MEDKERHAKGKEWRSKANLWRNARPCPEIQKVRKKETGVFVISKRRQAADRTQSQPRFARFCRDALLNSPGNPCAVERNTEQQWNIAPVPAAVEQIAGQEQKELVPLEDRADITVSSGSAFDTAIGHLRTSLRDANKSLDDMRAKLDSAG